MANDINLKSGNGITIDLSLSNKSLSIKINPNQLDGLIVDLLKDKNSAVYKKLKSILESTDITVGKAAYATNAGKAANATNATNAANATNATNADKAAYATNAGKAANADKLDSKDSSEFAVAKHKHKVADIEDLKYGPGDKSGTIFIKY